MKKKEAELLAKQKVNVIIEYIMQILSDSERVTSSMDFSSAKIDGNNMCTIDIYVPSKNFERHLNLGITSDHKNSIYKEFLNRVIIDFLPHDSIGATKFYRLRSYDRLFDGIKVINTIGSEIEVNMYGIDKNIFNEYNTRYEEFKNQNKKLL